MLVWDEYSGVKPTSPEDGHTSQYDNPPSSATDGATSSAITTTANGDLIYGGYLGIFPTIAAGTNYTLRQSRSAAGKLASEDYIQPSSGSVAATFTLSGGVYNGTAAVIAFLAGSGGGGPATYNDSVDETGSATDVPSNTTDFAASLSETTTASDTLDGPTNYTGISVGENASASDSIDGPTNHPAAISETTTASDAETNTTDFAPSLNEAGSASEAATNTTDFAPSLSETTTANDAASNTTVFATNLTESGSSSDALDGAANYTGISITESLTVMDLADGQLDGVKPISETTTPSDTTNASAVLWPRSPKHHQQVISRMG